MKYTIDAIDETNNHVTFTVDFGDGDTFTETKGDLPLDSKEALTAALEDYVKQIIVAHEAEKEEQSAVVSFKTQIVGKAVTIDASASK